MIVYQFPSDYHCYVQITLRQLNQVYQLIELILGIVGQEDQDDDKMWLFIRRPG